MGIYNIYKVHFKVFIDNFLKNEKDVLIVQKPQNLFIWSKYQNIVDEDLKVGYNKNFIIFYCEPPYSTLNLVKPSPVPPLILLFHHLDIVLTSLQLFNLPVISSCRHRALPCSGPIFFHLKLLLFLSLIDSIWCEAFHLECSIQLYLYSNINYSSHT
jgi:hypothetical protein